MVAQQAEGRRSKRHKSFRKTSTALSVAPLLSTQLDALRIPYGWLKTTTRRKKVISHRANSPSCTTPCLKHATPRMLLKIESSKIRGCASSTRRSFLAQPEMLETA